MNPFFQSVLMASLWIWGFHSLFQHPFILSNVSTRLSKHVKGWIIKPLYSCVVCMASIHGTAIYWLFMGESLINWVMFCVCVAGLNFIIKEHLYP